MSANYIYTKTIFDSGAFVSYISKTLPTVQSASTQDGIQITVVFSSALTASQQTTLTSLVNAYEDPVIRSFSQLRLLTRNISSTALSANATYTGDWEYIANSTVVLTVLSDASSATNGLQVQFGLNVGQPDITKVFTVAANSVSSLTLNSTGQFIRVVYQNGSTAQNTFSLQIRVPTCLKRSVESLNTAENAIPRVQVSFAYSINPESVNTLQSAGGSVSQSSGQAVLTASTTPLSLGLIMSRRYLICGIGKTARAVFSVSFSAGISGTTQLCGIGNDTDGLFIGYQGTQFGAMVRKSSVDTWYALSGCNVDKLDGTGSSGLVLNSTKGNVFEIIYDGSGYGTCSFGLCSGQQFITFHRVSFANSTSSMQLNSLPLTASASNGSSTSTGPVQMKLASFAGFTDGVCTSTIGKLHSADSTKTVSPGSTYIPLLTVSNLSTYQSLVNTIAMVLTNLTIGSSNESGNSVIALIEGSTLQNASFTPLSANSVASIDTAATSMSGGNRLWTECLSGSSRFSCDLLPNDIQIGASMKITVACKLAAARTPGIISAALSWTENA